MNRSRALAVDDDPEMCRLLADVLAGQGFSVVAVENSFEAAKMIKTQEFDIIITDLKMEGLQGIDLLEEATRLAPLTPVILITAFGTIESAIQAIKMGAYDYITKPFQVKELVLKVKKALENRQLKKEVKRLKQEIESRYQFQNLIGKSAAMQEVYELIEKIGDSSCNVLITGESGTGKELVAKAIHYNGDRKNGPFIAINCAAIPESLLESELFGYKKGAFTDARTDKQGLIFKAHGGTLFLDEVTEMAYGLEAKLLRVIEEREVRPLGDTKSYPVDVRVVCASNLDLQEVMDQGKFRKDLYYRLKVVDIEMPPLRERREDIPLLVQHFIEKYNREMNKEVSGVSPEALQILVNYSWPGNVRELENIVQRAMTLSRQEILTPENLPPVMTRKMDGTLMEKGLAGRYTMDQMEKEYIRRMLIEVGGNKTKAAEILGLDRKTLHRKIQDV